MKTVAFFNNKGGVGKTSLVYHLAWMYADHGLDVIAADLDPQANLTSMFLDEDRLQELWPDGEHPQSILGSIQPLLSGTGDIAAPHIEAITDQLGLIVGDLGLTRFEDDLSSAWPKCHDRKEDAFRTISAFYRALLLAATKREAHLVLIDVGPNLGAINRAALIAADYVVIPLAPDLFSLQGLRNLGPTLAEWRTEWNELRTKNPNPYLPLPLGSMVPAGYIILQHAIRLDRPVQAYGRWMDRIPAEYRSAVLGSAAGELSSEELQESHCLAMLKHYRSLMPMAQEARKPIFHLKPADGALGAHLAAAQECGREFLKLARSIAVACDFMFP